MDSFEQKLKQIFFNEANAYIQKIQANYELLIKNQNQNNKTDDNPLIDEILRKVHSLKGSAKAMQFKDLSRHLHYFESEIIDYKRNRNLLSLLELTDSLQAIYRTLETLQKRKKFFQVGSDLEAQEKINESAFNDSLSESVLAENIPQIKNPTSTFLWQDFFYKIKKNASVIAKSLNKKINLTFQTEKLDEINIDLIDMEQVSEAIMQILKNAIDHGIENQLVRRNLNKSLFGNIIVKLGCAGDELVIQVSDDGRGINPETLKASAVKSKIIQASDAMTDENIIRLIFDMGFSTKSKITQISGCGIGMNMVKANVDSLGGKIEVTSKVGGGTLVTFSVPSIVPQRKSALKAS